MTTAEAAHLALVRVYLRALETGESTQALAQFFTPDVIQVEFPNQLSPHGGKSDLPTLLQRAEQGKLVIAHQRFAIRSELSQGDRVAMEVEWSGVLQIPLGTLPAGGTLRAHFALFFVFRDGRICSQHNYDCFQPW